MTDIPFASEASRPDGQAGRLMRLATISAVSVAGSLIVIKLLAWLMTGSLALLSTLVDSVLDVGASVLNLLAVRVALEPADHDHRFGHGKAEPLAGLAQAAFIGGSALFLVFEAGSRILDPAPVTRSGIGIAVMVVSIVATLGLVAFQKYVVRQTGSVAVKADSVHYAGDVLVNLSVIAALLLATGPGWTWVDPLFAVGIAVYLLSNAWGILRVSLNLLMDKEFDEPDRQRILDIARDQPLVLDVHDLRTRSSGPDRFIQLHIDMDRCMPLWQAHIVADQVARALHDAFPGADVVIHQDPAGLSEPHAARIYQDSRPGWDDGEHDSALNR